MHNQYNSTQSNHAPQSWYPNHPREQAKNDTKADEKAKNHEKVD